jgi:hypothetical protein
VVNCPCGAKLLLHFALEATDLAQSARSSKFREIGIAGWYYKAEPHDRAGLSQESESAAGGNSSGRFHCVTFLGGRQ